MTALAIAHRGEPVGHRENTLPAFAAAVALGADMVEIDLRRTRDGEIVVLHDQTLERLWGVAASVGDLDLAEVAALGEGDVWIPSLREVLGAVPLPLMVDFTRREVVAGGLAAVRAGLDVDGRRAGRRDPGAPRRRRRGGEQPHRRAGGATRAVADSSYARRLALANPLAL